MVCFNPPPSQPPDVVCPLSPIFSRFLSAIKNTPGTSSSHSPTPPPLSYRSPRSPLSEACIKGHRSSACKHTDRPLFEIKKKGRPITQCEHCRELRKTKQVHVKCMCETKDNLPDKESAPARKKGEPVHKTSIPQEM